MDKYSASEALNVQLGQAGYDYVAASGSDVTLNSDTYIAITGLTATIADGSAGTVVTATSVDTNVWDNLSTVTIPQGVTIYGRWSSVVIADGDIAIVYRG
tara:strand:+ start:304 stop:603 length:300 start_codon:yes stop_codon:yes gene_type:complete